MDAYVIVLLAGAAIFLIFRLRQSFRKTRSRVDKTVEIERKLALLRKKRDED